MNRHGHDALWLVFGLSYASWLVLPRSMMHAMPDDWQGKMAALIDEFHATFDWPDAIDAPHVSIRGSDGRIKPMPNRLLDYRHPDRQLIDAARRPAAPQPQGASDA